MISYCLLCKEDMYIETANELCGNCEELYKPETDIDPEDL